MLLEWKILLHSKHRSLLNQVAEYIRELMSPLDWKNVYVPVCPERVVSNYWSPNSILDGSWFWMGIKYSITIKDMTCLYW